jgi:hypothetical protein
VSHGICRFHAAVMLDSLRVRVARDGDGVAQLQEVAR